MEGQALLAYATDGFLIGTAMRPHAGIGQSMAHVSISTSVLSHTLTFHEPVDAGRVAPSRSGEPVRRPRPHLWSRQHLRCGRHLVASFVQDNMVRSFPKS